MRLLSFLLSLIFSHTLLAKDEQEPLKEFNSLVNQYTKMMERKLTANKIPGAGLSIVKNGSGELAFGFGKTKRKGGLAVNKNTRFRLASVSKTFAGSLAAKLISEGRFDLDDSVTKYLPEFYCKYPGKELQVSHLLSHSSGIVPNAYDNLIETRMPYDEIASRLAKVEPICSPGHCYGYQNMMFSLIGDVIEKSTQIKYETWIEEFLFKPLNMKHASLGLKAMTENSNYAHPHVKARKKWYTARLKPHYYKVAPAAGVNASASDMVQWLKAQLGQYPSVLSQNSLSLQNTPYTKTSKELRRRVWRKNLTDAHYGLGWRIYKYNNELIYYHSGWVQGYRADVVVIPSLEIGFSLMINAEAGIINELTTDFINLVLNQNNKKRV